MRAEGAIDPLPRCHCALMTTNRITSGEESNQRNGSWGVFLRAIPIETNHRNLDLMLSKALVKVIDAIPDLPTPR